MKKKSVVVKTTSKKEMVNLFKTSYHYYRNWVKYILSDGKINSFRFLKDEVGWTGIISVPKSEVDRAKSILKDFRIKNPETIELWW